MQGTPCDGLGIVCHQVHPHVRLFAPMTRRLIVDGAFLWITSISRNTLEGLDQIPLTISIQSCGVLAKFGQG